MSGIFPAAPFATTGLTSEHRTLVSVAQSGRRQARKVSGQRWRFTARFAPMTRQEFAPILAFLMAQEGAFGTFQITPPELAVPQGVATGSPVVSATTASGNTIPTSGWTPNVQNILKAGDVVRFAGHSKVYMVTVDASSDATGTATLQVQPGLIAPVTNLEAVTVTNVPFTVSLDSDVISYRARRPSLFHFEIDLIEAY